MTHIQTALSTDRRSLLKGAAAIAAAAGGAPLGLAGAFAAAASDWVWQPMRWVQVNFTETIPAASMPHSGSISCAEPAHTVRA